jgi:hypothetical protein
MPKNTTISKNKFGTIVEALDYYFGKRHKLQKEFISNPIQETITLETKKVIQKVIKK